MRIATYPREQQPVGDGIDAGDPCGPIVCSPVSRLITYDLGFDARRPMPDRFAPQVKLLGKPVPSVRGGVQCGLLLGRVDKLRESKAVLSMCAELATMRHDLPSRLFPLTCATSVKPAPTSRPSLYRIAHIARSSTRGRVAETSDAHHSLSLAIPSACVWQIRNSSVREPISNRRLTSPITPQSASLPCFSAVARLAMMST
jgi:hypothetical protein